MKTATVITAFFLFTLSGCASKPAPPDITTAEIAQQATDPAAESAAAADPLTATEQLSSGKTTTIKTSQGDIEIQPTVVDMASRDDPETPEDEAAEQQYNDPLEGWNRAMFSFNHVAYSYALIPLVKGYEYVLPDVVRSKIGNAFSNIREPLSLLNNLAAGEVKDAGTNLGRFLINSTVGILGLFDPATAWFDLPPAKQSLADTLAGYNVSPGPYLVLPILGQNNVRGSTSVVSGVLLDPLRQITSPPDTYYLQGVDAVDTFSDRARVYEKLYQQADDPYLYFRNQFLQGVKRDDAFNKQPE
ncbi:phospholipid-binding lipoprotein MlaA [Rheinheimera pacifica]|uniref:Phospholipid-binding lipoprotein MlaA n=1 Tax=Rheinheimera pacifica TaxID=173990 RepID=A0A1H6JFJ5_9GAMM|nr:VacJ family lipoprotein [Rheinheimera pacifica]SEH61039.1 phospholipid-binding lipoprotein MlaA [Rheinheimera pacifica]